MSILLLASRQHLRRLIPSSSLRSLQQIQCSRAFSAAPKSPSPEDEDEDIVLDAFKEQQAAWRKLVEASTNIDIPMSGNEAAVKKYAAEMEKLRKDIGIPGVDKVLDAVWDYEIAKVDYSARKFIQAATEEQDVAGYSEVIDDLYAAVDTIEKETGLPLDAGNPKGWAQLTDKVAAIQKKHKIDKYENVKDQAVLEMYKEQIDEIKAKATESMEAIKRRDDLEFVKVDASSLKPHL